MKIAFLGDLVVDRDVTVDLAVVEFLAQADRVIANLEGVILKKGTVTPPFKSYGSVIYNDHEAVQKLIATVGITDVDLYNNHMIDFGEQVFDQTINLLSESNIQILGPENEWPAEDGNILLSNSGLAETFGIYESSKKYGFNINDMLFKHNAVDKLAGGIIHTHFGIEQILGLSDYELQWFDSITRLKPRIIIRHHPHCIQSPFYLNDIPCFPSIGDFAFNFNKKRHSNGLIVIFDTADSTIQCRVVECSNYKLRLTHDIIKPHQMQQPIRLSQVERVHLRTRYLREYREDALGAFKKSLKYLLGREKPEHVLSMSSKHFIQPYILGEIL